MLKKDTKGKKFLTEDTWALGIHGEQKFNKIKPVYDFFAPKEDIENGIIILDPKTFEPQRVYPEKGDVLGIDNYVNVQMLPMELQERIRDFLEKYGWRIFCTSPTQKIWHREKKVENT